MLSVGDGETMFVALVWKEKREPRPGLFGKALGFDDRPDVGDEAPTPGGLSRGIGFVACGFGYKSSAVSASSPLVRYSSGTHS